MLCYRRMLPSLHVWQTHQVLRLALQTVASPNQSQSARNANAQRAGNRVRGGKRPAPGTARAERPWMALAPFRSDRIPCAGSNLQLRCSSAPYPNLPQKFSSSFYSAEKKPVFSDRFLKWSAREDYPALRAAPCGPLLKQRCLATLGSNLLRRFSSSFFTQTKKNLSFQTGF